MKGLAIRIDQLYLVWLTIRKTERKHVNNRISRQFVKNIFNCLLISLMIQEGTTFDHDFYVVVGKQCRTENAYVGHQHNIFI